MIDESAIDPEDALELAERRELIRGMVDRLPDEKREVIRMVYDAEMDVAETAHALGIPEGTVRSRLFYARKHLAQECRNLGTEWEDI
jgi:RNA polymerase sigma-70 factor (ECF subfamily)